MRNIYLSLITFLHRQNGASAVFVAICIAMLITCTGIVIDGGAMLLSKSRAQGALDAAVLAAAKMPSANRVAEANKLFKANFPVDLTPYPQVTLTEPSAGILRGTVNVESPTLFMSFAGVDTVTVNLTSEVQFTVAETLALFSVAFDTSAAMGRPLSGGGGLRIDVLTQELQNAVNGFFTGSTVKYLSVIPYSDVVRTKSLTTTNWIDPTTLPNPITIPASVSLNLTCKGVRKGKASLLTDDAPTSNATKFPLYQGAMEFPSQFIVRAYDFNGAIVSSFNGTHPTYIRDRAADYRASPWYTIGVQPVGYPWMGGTNWVYTGHEPGWQHVAGGTRNNRIEYDPATGRSESVSVNMAQGQGFFWAARYMDLTPPGPPPQEYRYGLTNHVIQECYKNELGQIPATMTTSCAPYTLPTSVYFDSSYPAWPTVAGISSALASTWAYNSGGEDNVVEYTYKVGDNGNPAATNTKVAFNFYYMPMCGNKEAMFLEKDKTKAYNYFTNFYQCDTPSGCGLWPVGLRKFMGGPTRTDRGIAWLQYTTSDKWRGFLNPAEPTQPNEATMDRNVLLIAHGENLVPAEDNPNTLAICTNLKNRGITVHTIAYDASMATRSLMQQCASPGKSHNVDTRAQLRAALSSMAGGGGGSATSPARLIK